MKNNKKKHKKKNVRVPFPLFIFIKFSAFLFLFLFILSFSVLNNLCSVAAQEHQRVLVLCCYICLYDYGI